MRSRNFRSISFVLVLVMVISMIGFNVDFSEKSTESPIKTKLKEFSISENELDQIVSVAKQDGESAAKAVSKLEGNDFELAVNQVLTAYYEKGQDSQRKVFEKNVDAKADNIVKDFAEAAAERKNEEELPYEAGASLLTFDSDVTEDEIKAIVKDQYGSCDYIYENADGSHLVKVKNSLGLTVEKAVKAYGEYIETTAVACNDKVEQVVSATELVNDPFAGDQYYLTNMQVPDAWQYIRARNHSRVRVAVIDGGADMNCVDLRNNSPALSIEVLSDGSSIPLRDSAQQYINDHGTWVASVIGGTANNGQQIAGIASNVGNDIVELMNIKIELYVDKIALGLDYALQNGAKVVNISLYHGGANDVERAAVDRFYAAGGTVVCGAGNDGNDAEGYPSDYENTISVIAVDRNNQLRGTSNRGWRKDISAPGTDIYVASAGDSTVIANGTSLASPMVAGIATLMYSINPNISSARVKEIILSTAQDIGDPGRDYYYGYGLANAYKSVVTADNGSVGQPENPTNPPIQDDGFTQCATDVNTNVGDWTYYVGSWAGASARYQGGDLNDFALKINSNNGDEWGIQAFTERGVTPGHTYNYSVTLHSDTSGANVLLKDDVKTDNAPDGRDLTSLTLQQGDNVFSGTYTPESDRIKLFLKLGALTAGTTVRVTNVTLTDVTPGGSEPEPTNPPQETTKPSQDKPDVPKEDDWSVVENSNNLYEYANADNMIVDNVQHPAWAREDGVYVRTSEGIGYVTINGTKAGDDHVAVDGAGAVIYLSILNNERTEIVYYRNDGSYLGSVDIKKKAGTVVEPDTPEPTNAPENPTEAPTDKPNLPDGGTWSIVENSNKVYEYANASNMDVVNVQKPGFAKEDGIYMSTSEGIGYITINGTKVGEEAVAIDGAGAVIYLSALNSEKSQIIYYRNDGSYLGSVDIRKGGEQPPTEQPGTSEQPTQEPETTQPAGITISNDINITGYQMTAFLHNIEGNMGFRVVYQAEPTIEGQTATEIGLVYGIGYGNNPISEADMVYGSDSRYIKSYAATNAGRLTEIFGESTSATYYARTMSCGVADGSNNISTKAYTTQYYVRAYAKLSDGRIVYSKVNQYTVYDIADYVYQNHKVTNEVTYDYLYTRILKYVNNSYQKGDYNWNNVIVK